MSDLPSWVFDDMKGSFEARLKRTSLQTRTSRGDGREITVSNTIAIVESKFSYEALDRLHYPSFIAIERDVNGSPAHIIFEVVSVSPTHYQMLGMDSSMPTLLRKEYLDTINDSWGKSQETWIDLAAIPTWYIANVSGDDLRFDHTRFTPLAGATARLLSRRAVERFLCYEGGATVGTMVGFDLPLTVSLNNLVRFHSGIFGFTGSGKSNLTSSLLRMAIKQEDLTAVVFDVAGEYAINLLDLLSSGGRVVTNEYIDDPEQFFNSQAIPESLEDEVGQQRLQDSLTRVFKKGVIERLSLQESGGLDLAWIQQLLDKAVAETKAGGTTAKIALEELSTKLYDAKGLHPSSRISDLERDARRELEAILVTVHDKSHEKSGLRSELEPILEMLRAEGVRAEGPAGLTPERIAHQLADNSAPRLNIFYLPDPISARMTVSRLVNRLLYLRKRIGNKGRILFVLDEAQEYIPDVTSERQFTAASNGAVEALLRQGRKYRIHCWLATQRVAHLNVSALQQLHSYFVSTLPRMYDRMVIADSFALPYEVLERSAQLETGEWIFVSYKATKQKNVPIFVKTDNNEAHLSSYLKTNSE